MIRVFPRRTQWTPTDELSFVGYPHLLIPREDHEVFVSVTFTWDIPLAHKLQKAWSRHYSEVYVGGPALDDPGRDFVPGKFLKPGITITSRGCIRRCPFCLVSKREGGIRELPIRDGWVVQDNNLLACSRHHVEAVFDMLRRQPHPIDFPGGIDTRLLRPWHIDHFKDLKLGKIWVAADDNNLQLLLNAATLLIDIPKSKKFCYVLIGFGDDTIEAAEKRLRMVWDVGFYPFAMLYKGPEGEGHKSKEWRQFQRQWCRPAIYKAIVKGKADQIKFSGGFWNL